MVNTHRDTHDADMVVVGSGHNGLVVAAYAAVAGYKVIVCEKREDIGGAVCTRDMFGGYKMDVGGSLHCLIHRTPIIQELQLAKYGLEYIEMDPILSVPLPNGRQFCIFRSLERTCQSIARISERDAESYYHFVQKWRPLNAAVFDFFLQSPTALNFFKTVLQPSHGMNVRRRMAVLSELRLSYGEIIRRTFENEYIRGAMAWWAAQSGPPPHQKNGAEFFAWQSMLHEIGAFRPKGGSGMLTRALARCIQDHGGIIMTSAAVAEICTENNRVWGVRLESAEARAQAEAGAGPCAGECGGRLESVEARAQAEAGADADVGNGVRRESAEARAQAEAGAGPCAGEFGGRMESAEAHAQAGAGADADVGKRGVRLESAEARAQAEAGAGPCAGECGGRMESMGAQAGAGADADVGNGVRRESVGAQAEAGADADVGKRGVHTESMEAHADAGADADVGKRGGRMESAEARAQAEAGAGECGGRLESAEARAQSAQVITAPIVVANAHIKIVFEKLLQKWTPPRLKRRIATLNVGNGFGMVLRCATDALPQYTADRNTNDMLTAGIQVLCPSISYLEDAYADFTRGRPARNPAALAMTFSTIDRTLAPAGKHTLFIWGQYYPFTLRAGLRWEDIAHREAQKLIAVVERAAPGIDAAIRDCYIQSPVEIARLHSMPCANVMHLEMTIDTMFMRRPCKELRNYHTPLEGLFLANAGMHPGGGISGAAGYNCYAALLPFLERSQSM